MGKKIKARILKGVRDILPEEMNARNKIVNTITKVFESYGFAPIASPALEFKEILCGYGDEASKQIYTFTDPDKHEVGLRFDLTVPLSRIIAQHRDLLRPFKRYQFQPVWRFDKPDPGRFREFMQFDIDTIGVKSLAADAEIIAAMNDSLKELGVDWTIRYSSRKILNTLIKFAGINQDLLKPVLRVIDKLDKQGFEKVKLELGEGRIDESGAKIEGVGLNSDQIRKIEEFLEIPRKNRADTIEALTDLFKGIEGAEKNIAELSEISDYLNALGIKDDRVVIDVSIARGLDYYTGTVFEAILNDAPRFGSVMGGGRYDELIQLFSGQPTAAVGASIGVDRLLSALTHLKKIKTKASVADVLITVMDKSKMLEYLKLAKELRDADIKTEVYLGKPGSIGNQLKYADRLNFPVAILIGEDEFNNNQVSVKDLRKIEDISEDIKDRDAWLKARIGQQTIHREKLIETIRKILL